METVHLLAITVIQNPCFTSGILVIWSKYFIYIFLKKLKRNSSISDGRTRVYVVTHCMSSNDRCVVNILGGWEMKNIMFRIVLTMHKYD